MPAQVDDFLAWFPGLTRKQVDAVLQHAEHLRRRRKGAIAEQYARAYGASPDLSGELSGWEGEGAWTER